MNGAVIVEKPLGFPRLRSVMRVAPFGASSHVYVVSMGNGPSDVRITSFSSATSSTISYVYAMRRPRKCATNAICDPTCAGREVFHSTDAMLAYQSGAFVGSAA